MQEESSPACRRVPRTAGAEGKQTQAEPAVRFGPGDHPDQAPPLQRWPCGLPGDRRGRRNPSSMTRLLCAWREPPAGDVRCAAVVRGHPHHVTAALLHLPLPGEYRNAEIPIIWYIQEPPGLAPAGVSSDTVHARSHRRGRSREHPPSMTTSSLV